MESSGYVTPLPQPIGAHVKPVSPQNAAVCAICHENIVYPGELECTHAFCLECVHSWACSGGDSCPVCRHPIEKIVYRALDETTHDIVCAPRRGRPGLIGMLGLFYVMFLMSRPVIEIEMPARQTDSSVSLPRRSARIREQRARRGQDNPYNPRAHQP